MCERERERESVCVCVREREIGEEGGVGRKDMKYTWGMYVYMNTSHLSRLCSVQLLY